MNKQNLKHLKVWVKMRKMKIFVLMENLVKSNCIIIMLSIYMSLWLLYL